MNRGSSQAIVGEASKQPGPIQECSYPSLNTGRSGDEESVAVAATTLPHMPFDGAAYTKKLIGPRWNIKSITERCDTKASYR